MEQQIKREVATQTATAGEASAPRKREVAAAPSRAGLSTQDLILIAVLLAAGAVLIGIPMSMGASQLISVSMASDMYTIPSFIDGKALLQAIGLTAVSVGFSSMMMLLKLKKIVPADLLRERE